MGTKSNPGRFDCYGNAHPDEPMFILLGRDRVGGSLMRLWAAVRELMGEDKKKVAEARECAAAMDDWRQGRGMRLEVLEWLPFDLLAAEWRRRGMPVPQAVKAVPVVRDADGHWMHPDWPWRATPEETSEAPTARAIGLELKAVTMESQVSDEVMEQYHDSNSPNCHAWTPAPPDGDPAWFLTAIFDTEDGPAAHWCRPLPAETKLWGVHVSGPDDLHAAPSREEAAAAAERFNTWFSNRADKHPFDPQVHASVTEWPYGEREHALSVQDWATFAEPAKKESSYATLGLLVR
jgi:hypothetical protein